MATEFTAYFDDSGHPDDQDAVIAAGWISIEEQWLRFEKEWKEKLAIAKIKSGVFHMTDFETNAPGGEYSHLSESERNILLKSLINTIRTRVHCGFVAIVPMADYKDVNEIFALEECLGKPYALGGRHVAGEVRIWSRRYHPGNEQAVVIFEDGTKHKGDLMDVFERDGFEPPIFRKKNLVTSLQASDLFAWECFNAYKTGKIRSSLKEILKSPYKAGMFTYDKLLENCKQYDVNKRIPGVQFDVRLAALKKKPRKRQIFGPAEPDQVRGKARL